MRTTLQSCVTKHIYICSLQVCTPGRGTRKSHAIQPQPPQGGSRLYERHLRDSFGSAAGKNMIVQRGRWCDTDIDEIYSRASLGEHVAASVALSGGGTSRSLEDAAVGWVQPTAFRR